MGTRRSKAEGILKLSSDVWQRHLSGPSHCTLRKQGRLLLSLQTNIER